MSGNECLNDEVCDESGKNAFAVFCKRCNCLILREKQASFVAIQIELPLSEVKTSANNANEQQIDKESLNEHWYVENIYTFENMGFSNTVNDTKYLVCAECEYGPLGLHYIKSNQSYLSLSRVAFRKNEN